jgi:hypothetical protein
VAGIIEGIGSWATSHDGGQQTISFALTCGLAIANYLLRPKAKLIWGPSHGFVFTVPNANVGQLPYYFYSQTLNVQNVGRATAKNVEVHLVFKPEHFQVWPAFKYEAGFNPEGHFVINIPNLGPREWVSVEMLQTQNPLPLPMRVRTEQGEWKQVAIGPSRIMPRWFHFVVWAFMLLGLFQLLQFVIALVWR